MRGAAVFVCLLLGWVSVATLRRLRGPQADRLAITLYYEALCPYCMEFVTTQLKPSMIRQDRLPFTDLTLVPYGNAMLKLVDSTTAKSSSIWSFIVSISVNPHLNFA
ncbi:GILT-like protein 2 isoform X2 [Drosophila sechellia]|uniref:GILT-like protein 2 isoform X2 n=1 Tax=Drosophila sechellia TaxID=7238 RepID=UPI0013DE7890|nr:GILT-like protein 2 isoform X2 [Drosophila sechellia]